MGQKESNYEVEIDLKEFFLVLLSKIWVIILTGVIFAIAAFLISKFVITPQYQSSTKIYIMNKQNESTSITYSDLQTGASLTKDYMTLVTSRPVIEQVISDLELDISYEGLVEMISVENPTDTRILSITVEYEDPIVAKQIADAVRDQAAAQITQVMDIEKVNTVEEANVPDGPASPNVQMYSILGAIIGLFLSAFIVLILHITNDKIKTPDDIERFLGLSTLTCIPLQNTNKATNYKRRKKKTT